MSRGRRKSSRATPTLSPHTMTVRFSTKLQMLRSRASQLDRTRRPSRMSVTGLTLSAPKPTSPYVLRYSTQSTRGKCSLGTLDTDKNVLYSTSAMTGPRDSSPPTRRGTCMMPTTITLGNRPSLSNNTSCKKKSIQKRQLRGEHGKQSRTKKRSKRLMLKRKKRDLRSTVNKRDSCSKVQHNKVRRDLQVLDLDQGHVQKELNEPPVNNAVSDSSSSSFRVLS